MKVRLGGGLRAAAIGALALFVVWGAMWVYPRIMLANTKVVPVTPGRVDLVAVHKESGYRIIVSNGIAHLVEVTNNSENFDAPDDTTVIQDAARLPIRETLKALQGDADALGKMVMSVNKMREDDLPNVRVVWRAEDIQKALEGDAELVKRLETNLNTRLDGSPLDTVSLEAVMSGIVIDAPVDVEVPFEGKKKKLTCRIQEPFKTLFAGAIEKKVNERFKISNEALLGFYRDEANKLLSGNGRKENVAASLKSHIEPSALQQLALAPDKILANTRVLVNENQMSGASYVTFEGPNRSILSNVALKLTDDGKMRLWKYSHDNPGFQLLLTVDGVAIAAPRIQSELAGNEVKLTRVPSKELVEDAVAFINKSAGGSK